MSGPRPGDITDEMRRAARTAYAQGLQRDLRILAERLRAEAPDESPGFNAGIDWAVLWLENTANQLTDK